VTLPDLRRRQRRFRVVYALVSPTHWLPAVAVLWLGGATGELDVASPVALVVYVALAVRSFVRTKTADRLAFVGSLRHGIALDEGRAELSVDDLEPEIAQPLEEARAAVRRLGAVLKQRAARAELKRVEVAIDRLAWRAVGVVWDEPVPPALTAGLAELRRVPDDLDAIRERLEAASALGGLGNDATGELRALHDRLAAAAEELAAADEPAEDLGDEHTDDERPALEPGPEA
jgi:hypothetical protein